MFRFYTFIYIIIYTHIYIYTYNVCFKQLLISCFENLLKGDRVGMPGFSFIKKCCIVF